MEKDSVKQRIWSAALRVIERRPHSKKELRDKLTSKFLGEEEVILSVIEAMERVHLLSDQQFAEGFIAHLTQRNVGRFKIMFETRQKGLSMDLVEQILLNQDWSEEVAAKKAIEEKARTLENLDGRKKKQRLMAFLRSRGFTDRVIYKALSHTQEIPFKN